MSYKKPRLNQTVYVVFEEGIYEEKARYIGENSFLVEISSMYVDDFKEWWYGDYGVTWAFTLNKAKTILRKILGVKKLDLECKYENWWRLKEEDE